MEAPVPIIERTIQHPGFEFVESDLSRFREYVEDQCGLVVGYASQGPIGSPFLLTNISDFKTYFGVPENDQEFYAYTGINNIISNNGKAVFIRMPYFNKAKNNYRCLKFKFRTQNSGLDEYKKLFENEKVSFKNLDVTPDHISLESLEEFSRKGGNEFDFIIFNKFNTKLRNGEELLITVLGRGNSAIEQGLLKSKKEIDIFDYNEFYSEDFETVGKLRCQWAYGEIDNLNKKFVKMFPQIKTTISKDENGFYNKKILQSNEANGNITIIVSKIKRSVSVPGSYDFNIMEIYNGQIFKGSVDNLSKESNYIGDIINECSDYIGFAGKESYRNFNKSSDELIVREQIPYRIVLAGSEYLDKAILDENSDVGTLTEMLEKYLSVMNNPFKYTFTDIYDCGLSSVMIYAKRDPETGKSYYDPSVSDSSEKEQIDFLKSEEWTSIARVFERYCKYVNRVCMTHMDAPRKLTLNGDLSRDVDLNQDTESLSLTTEKLESVFLKDNYYCETNLVWVEVPDAFRHVKCWIPPSALMAETINKIETSQSPWIVPAGRKNAYFNGISRLSVHLSPDDMDRVYQKNINYMIYGPNLTVNFEGNKMGTIVDYQFNRINVRRTINHLKRYVMGISKQYIGETNNTATRDSYKNDIESEFERVKLLGGINDYIIDVGSTVNTDFVVQNNELRAKIIVKPVSSIEYILANVIITRSGINLEEKDTLF